MSCGKILREKYCLLLERLDRFYNNYEMNFVSLQEVFGNPIYQDLPKILLKFNEIKNHTRPWEHNGGRSTCFHGWAFERVSLVAWLEEKLVYLGLLG